MWMPTHVQVTVQKAADLITKGKNNTNDCFVTIGLGKTKYQTSVKKKSESTVEWHEECELPIPEQGNTAEIVLTVLHQNFLNVDEFLGRVTIPLNNLDTYERPKNKWFPLVGKPGKPEKARGRLEARIAFTVKSGSLTDLSKKEKHKSSIGQLSTKVGGSLLSLASADKRKGIKKIAKSIGSKMNLKGKKGHKDDDNSSSIGSVTSINRRHGVLLENTSRSRQTYEDADPGVVSDEDEDFMFDDLSHKSSGSSLNTTQVPRITDETHERPALPPSKPPRVEAKTDEWEMKLNKNSSNTLKPSAAAENPNRRSWESPKLSDRIEEEEDTHELSHSLQDFPMDETVISRTPTKTPELPHKEKVKEKLKESMFTKLRNLRKDKNEDKHDRNERVIIGGESEPVHSTSNNRISNELLQKYEGKTREDLILLLSDSQSDLEHNRKKLKDLEDYLDELLLRVMETQPKILQNPYVNCKLAHKKWLESNDG